MYISTYQVLEYFLQNFRIKWFCSEAVGLEREGVDGEAPAVAFGELAGPFAKKEAADRTSHFEGAVVGGQHRTQGKDYDLPRLLRVPSESPLWVVRHDEYHETL